MQWVLVFVLALLASILYGPVQTFISARAASNTSLANLTTSYAGRTLMTATAFFLVIVASAFVLGMVGKKPTLPG